MPHYSPLDRPSIATRLQVRSRSAEEQLALYEEGVVPFLASLLPWYVDAFEARGKQIRSSDVFLWSVAVGAWELASMLWRRMTNPVRLGLRAP